jgi:anti-sigma factor RsiW
MIHLGDLAAALVDNELTDEARERALAHISRCAECRAEVDRQRRLRAVLANQADPQMPADLADRLLLIAANGSEAPTAKAPSEHRGWVPSAAAAFVPSGVRRRAEKRRSPTATATRPAGRPAPRRFRRAVAGSAAMLALTVGLAAAGGPAASGRTTTPPVDRFLQEHAVSTARLPFGDARAGLVESVVLGR